MSKNYKPHDTFFWANADDKVLRPIKIPLPDPPDLKKIDGYGLKPEDQYFQRQKYPHKLKKLEKDCGGVIDEIWKNLYKHQKTYRDEIRWIKKQWYHRLYGYWFFNNGKPTYINGWNFQYLNYFHIDIGFPKYRDRDRRWFLCQRFAYDLTTDFKNKDENGWAIADDNGVYELVDIGRRWCSGTSDLKGRRFGDTYKGCCIGLDEITRAKDSGAIFGIQGENETRGKQDFVKVVHAWRKYPFFFMPEYDNTTNPKETINFYKPSIKGGNNLSNLEGGLEAIINFASTSSSSFYDGDKLLFYLSDEDGKLKSQTETISDRWRIVKECLFVGNDRKGFSIHPTTVGQMEKGGGAAFRQLCDNSMYHQRNKNGETLSGLITFFFPAYDGLEGFIDGHGMSIIDTPTQEQAIQTGKSIGSKEYLQNTLDSLLKKGTPDAMRAYRERKRLYPSQYEDAFLSDSGDIGMPYEKIDARLAELALMKDTVRIGNYKRIDPLNPDSDIIWEENPLGRWEVSYDLPPERRNKRFMQNGIWTPLDPAFTASADPFRTEKKRMEQKQKASDGGGAVFWNRDLSIDPMEKEISEFITNRFVCTYLYRHETPEEFAEDMLMMCIYWGAMIYPENNIDLISPYFMKRGYGGYLLYGFERDSGHLRKNAGFNSGGASKQILFNQVISYLQKHCHRERHAKFLLQCKNIKDLDDMTNYDLFTAGGGCLLGILNQYNPVYEKKEQSVKIEDFFEDYS